MHSRKSRTGEQREFLERAGDSIVVLELQGALFFGTGETLAKHIETLLGKNMSCVVVDLRRLTEIDSTGANIILELKSDLTRRKTGLLLAAGDHTVAMQRLNEYGVLGAIDTGDIYPDVDRAIERAEDDLLRTRAPERGTELELAEIPLFAGFKTGDIEAVTGFMKRKIFTKDAVLFREVIRQRGDDRHQRQRERLFAITERNECAAGDLRAGYCVW